MLGAGSKAYSTYFQVNTAAGRGTLPKAPPGGFLMRSSRGWQREATAEAGQSSMWAAFGDLMACLFGLFVLLFCWMVMSQAALNADLAQERESRAATQAKLDALQSALAGPLGSGLITLVDGRIGIRGSVLFPSSKATLRGEGLALIERLAPPLSAFLAQRDEALMVSGFTDDRPLRKKGAFQDNWELSSARALTVTRALVAAGIPADRVVAAGFGEHHPMVDNDSPEHRAMNRRVEIAPVPRPTRLSSTAQTPAARARPPEPSHGG